MLKYVVFVCAAALISCNSFDPERENVFFAGEIVNPTSEYVSIYKGDVLIDSALLDENNRFHISFTPKNSDGGLYYFSHLPESQYVYLEKGDSLMLRINTIDFDESLVFDGVGNEINNFLVELFLSYETEGEDIKNFYSLEADDFSKKIDSLHLDKIMLLEELATENNISLAAKNMAKASIDYNSYIYKEKYPFYHKRSKGYDKLESLASTFYAYRKDLNYNDSELSYFRPYFNFMKYHFGNLSHLICTDNCDSITRKQDPAHKLHVNQHKLALIDSLAKDKVLRDNLFRNVALDYFLKVHDSKDNNTVFLDQLHSVSPDNKHMGEINELFNGITNLQPNSALPTVDVLDFEGKPVTLNSLALKGKTAFYFWSNTRKKHFNDVIKKVNALSKSNPEYTFIGINVKTDEETFKELVISNQLDRTKQFRAPNFEALAKLLIIDAMDKSILVENGKITNGFGNLYHSF